jgi:hypothetical protein
MAETTLSGLMLVRSIQQTGPSAQHSMNATMRNWTGAGIATRIE